MSAADYVFNHRTNFYGRGPIRGHRGEFKFQMIRTEPDEIVSGRQFAGDLRLWQVRQLAKLGGWELIISDGYPEDSKERGFPQRRGSMGFKFQRVYVYVPPGDLPSAQKLRKVKGARARDGWLGGSPDKQNPLLMVGLVKPARRLVEIDPGQLREIGIAAYEFGFNPLLAYAEQHPPFVKA